MKVVIMAGGKGTRIASIKSDVPKPMLFHGWQQFWRSYQLL